MNDDGMARTSWRMSWLMCVAGMLGACGYGPLPSVPDGSGGDPGSPQRTAVATLDWQVFVGSTTSFVPITPPPIVRIALIGQPDSAFEAATYERDGTISTAHPPAAPWRLEYTLADGVPHELQWMPDAGKGHIAIPLVGRVARDPIPSGSGYAITPTGVTGALTSPRVFTTGLWSEAQGTVSGSTIDYAAADAVPMSGAPGRLVPEVGDQAIAIDYTVTNGCRRGTGAATIKTALQAGTHVAVAPAWETTTSTPAIPTIGTAIITRLNALGDLVEGLSTSASLTTFGAVPSLELPGLAATASTAASEGLSLPTSVMISLGTCPFNMSISSVATPNALAAFPEIAQVQLVGARAVQGVTLSSGMETVLASVAGAFTMAFPAPFATQIALLPPTGSSVSLGGDAAEPVSFSAMPGQFLLTFGGEAGSDLRVDDYEVILHRIESGHLTTDRIYTLPTRTSQAALQIDGSLFTSGVTYVFEIRAVKGHPNAPTGDFATVDYPYGQTIVFARSFVFL